MAYPSTRRTDTEMIEIGKIESVPSEEWLKDLVKASTSTATYCMQAQIDYMHLLSLTIR